VATNSRDEIFVIEGIYQQCYRSTDAGQHWTNLGKIDGSYIFTSASDTKGNLYFGTMANVYRNDAGSAQFTTASPTMATIQKIVSDSQGNLVTTIWMREPTFYSDSSGVEWGYGTLAFSTDGGAYWDFSIAAPPYMDFGSPYQTLHANGETIVVTHGGDYNAYTTNGGRSWDQWTFIPMLDRFTREVTPVKNGRVYSVHSLNGPDVYFDSGRRAMSFHRDPSLFGELKKPNYHYITIARSPDDYIFLGMYDAVARMKDGDTVWNRCDIPSIHDSVHSFAFWGNKVYALTSFNGIFESSTNGAQWTSINNGLPSLSVRQLISDRLGNLYLATRDGVFRRKAGQNSWENITANIGSTDVTTLCYVPKVGLYVGTRGRGIFFTNDIPLDSTDVPLSVDPPVTSEKLRLSRDPITNSVMAHFKLEDPSEVSVSVVNVLGVVLWRSQVWSTEEGEIAIPTSPLPNGFYLVRLSANGLSTTTPFVK
jgi:hypothetical protein